MSSLRTKSRSSDLVRSGSSSSLNSSSLHHPSNGATVPLHQRKYTAHSYFSNTLRDVLAGLDPGVVVLIPQHQTELTLRKHMFKQYKDQSIRTLKEYEVALKQMVQEQAVTVDVRVNQWIRKRYLFLKGDVQSGVVKPDEAIPVKEEIVELLRQPPPSKSPKKAERKMDTTA